MARSTCWHVHPQVRLQLVGRNRIVVIGVQFAKMFQHLFFTDFPVVIGIQHRHRIRSRPGTSSVRSHARTEALRSHPGTTLRGHSRSPLRTKRHAAGHGRTHERRGRRPEPCTGTTIPAEAAQHWRTERRSTAMETTAFFP